MEIFIILCILFLFGIFLRIVGKIQIKKFVSEKANADVILHRRMEQSRIPHLLVKDNIKFRKEEMTQFYPIEACVNDFALSIKRYYERWGIGDLSMEDILNNSVFLIEITDPRENSNLSCITLIYSGNGDGKSLPFHYDLIKDKLALINLLLIYKGIRRDEFIDFLSIPFSDILYISRGTKK